MKKLTLKLTTAVLGLSLISGLAGIARAENEKKADKPPAAAAEPKKATINLQDPEQKKTQSHEGAGNKCKFLDCHNPKCSHDWSKYELNLTPEQTTQIKALKERINKTTVGMNWCTRDAARHRLAELRKDKKAGKTAIDQAKAELKRIVDGIAAGHKEYRESFLNQILTGDQRQKFLDREAALKEHQKMCQPKHNPNCQYYRKKNINNEGDYIKYCEDDAHLTQGIFECPGYKDAKREEHKAKSGVNQTEKGAKDKPAPKADTKK
ncbi:MAG: hypothetical protein WC980_06180 [Candidatus Brocadiia bacterium]